MPRVMPPIVKQKPRIPHYTLVKRLGSGGFGEVWLAKNFTSHYFALKVVYRAKHNKNYAFNRELKALTDYQPIAEGHPCVLRILHIGKEPDFLYYTMPLADDIDNRPFNPNVYKAKTLKAVLDRQHHLPIDEAIAWIIPILGALGYIHARELIHRDIKPDNILFKEGKPLLGDISLVAKPSAELTVVGTAGFAPPGGCKTIADDLFSVGKMLYAMISGYSIDRYPDVPSLPEQGSLALFPGVNRIITESCELRYQSAGDMAHDLQQLLSIHAGSKVNEMPAPKATLTSDNSTEPALTQRLPAAGFHIGAPLIHKDDFLLWHTSHRSQAEPPIPGFPDSPIGLEIRHHQFADLLGQPIHEERPCPDKAGRYCTYERGSIHWHPFIGAFETHGAIREKWSELKWEMGVLGYPVSNEEAIDQATVDRLLTKPHPSDCAHTKSTSNTGDDRISFFLHGALYWRKATDSVQVLYRTYRDSPHEPYFST